MYLRKLTLGLSTFLVCFIPVHATSIPFVRRELFRVPFGTTPDTLGAEVKDGQFLFPRDFAMDNGGHVYIYDSIKHRIARFSSSGRYEMEFRYLPTAQQVFAHPDDHQNLWLLLSDPGRGLYYGVYDAQGRRLRDGVFSQFNRFRLHVDDEGGLHIVLSSDRHPEIVQTYLFDQATLRMQKESIAPPPETHHAVHQNNRVFFIDQMPGQSRDAQPINRITDTEHHGLADIKGAVIYVTESGEIYTLIGQREINIYDVNGTWRGKVMLEGLGSACTAIRFDSEGNIYELDGIPDHSSGPPDQRYSQSMPGMRLLRYQRQ